ncbi:helix-turn-helix domain-containing protein [Oceanobacillus sp. CAU 1775]
MLLNNFALSSMKVKSNWFEGGKQSVFQQMGKEEGLNLYIQLFRFRQHQMMGSQKGNYENHVFRVTIGELKEYTKIGYKSKLRNHQVLDLLKLLSKAGVIKLHKPSRWSYLLDDDGKVKADNIIVLQATDVPQTHIGKNENGQDVDKPVDENEDWYIPVNFNMVDYIYNDLGLSSKEMTVYLLMLKLSNGGRKEAFININTMKEWLGFSNDTIINILITLNENYLLVTNPRHLGKKVSFYHTPVRSHNQIEIFKKEKENDVKKFLKRYKRKEKSLT